MKQHTVRYLLALGLSAALITPVSASGDTLISRSYLEDTYRPRLSAVVRDSVELASQPLLNAALSGMDRYFTGAAGAWRTTLGFTAQGSDKGDALTLASGAGLFWTSGTGILSSGVLVDATAGRELVVGGALTAGHRYIADGEAKVSVTAAAQWLAEGTWRTDPGGGEVRPRLPFTDVPAGAWYYDAVEFAYERGTIDGTGDGSTFSPDMTTSRAMFVMILYHEAGSPSVSGGTRFSDVPSGIWYEDAVTWAANNHIVNGYNATTFAPNDPMTREQTAVILYGFAKYRGLDVSASAGLDGFADGADTDGWAQEGMRWAVAAGIFQGNNEKKLLPQKETTRAEAAGILMNYCQKVSG